MSQEEGYFLWRNFILLPSPLRNLLTPLCSPLGKVSRYSWARTSNRPGDERYQGILEPCLCTSAQTFFLDSSGKGSLASEPQLVYEHAFKHEVYRVFNYPYNCPTLYNGCLWEAAKSAHTRDPLLIPASFLTNSNLETWLCASGSEGSPE